MNSFRVVTNTRTFNEGASDYIHVKILKACNYCLRNCGRCHVLERVTCN